MKNGYFWLLRLALLAGNLHAPSATIDDAGRFLAIFNVKEGKVAQGWNDVMTLPRHLYLAASLLLLPAVFLFGGRWLRYPGR